MSRVFHLNFEAIGTRWVIDIYGKQSHDERLEKKVLWEIKKFSDIFSRFDLNSEVSLGANTQTKIKISKKYLSLLDTYQQLYQLTKGKFTPLIGNLLANAGYDRNYSLTPGKLKPVLKWEEVLDYSPPFLKVKKPYVLGFGAGGKGFLVDLVGNLLQDEDISSYCIDAGGDILYMTKNDKPLKVGLEHPEDFKKVLGVAEISNQSICASAGNRRQWRKYHHIFNPETLDSVKNILAV